MKIGELANAAGVSTQAIRFYERQGILPDPKRLESGYRDYGEDAPEIIEFIKEAKAVGLTLSDVKKLTGLDPESPKSCDFMQELVTAKLSALDEKLRAMKRMRKRLAKLSEQCRARDAEAPCPALLEILHHC